MLDLLLNLWREYLEPVIHPLTTSVPLLRGSVLLLVTILVLMVAFHRRIIGWFAEDARSREHDLALFKKGDALINEGMLYHLLNESLFNHWCAESEIFAVADFCREFSRVEHQFLDRHVSRDAQAAIGALHALDRYSSTHFFRVAAETDRYYLYPELKHGDEKQRDRYKRAAAELDPLAVAAWEAFKTYRRTVKQRLKV